MAEHGILDIDDDTLFEFIGKLPVTKTFYDGQFRIHPTEAGQQTVLRFLGKTYEPIATIVMDNSDGNKEICTYVKSEDNSSKKKVLGLFVGGIAKSYEYALLNCACIFMFGATERTKFPLQMFSTSALQTKYPMPSLSFVREMAKCQPTALHSSVWVSKEISPFVTTLSRFLGMCTFGSPPVHCFKSEAEFDVWLSNADMAPAQNDLFDIEEYPVHEKRMSDMNSKYEADDVINFRTQHLRSLFETKELSAFADSPVSTIETSGGGENPVSL